MSLDWMNSYQQLGSQLSACFSNNRYHRQVNTLGSALSIYRLNRAEALNGTWRYEIKFTSSNHQLRAEDFLKQTATLPYQNTGF